MVPKLLEISSKLFSHPILVGTFDRHHMRHSHFGFPVSCDKNDNIVSADCISRETIIYMNFWHGKSF